MLNLGGLSAPSTATAPTSFKSTFSFLSELSLLPCSRLFVLVSGTDIEPIFTMRGLSGPPPSNAHYDKLAREREEARRVNGWEAAKNQEYDLFKQRGQLEGRLYDALESILHLLDISHASEEMLVDLGQELVDDERKPARQRARVARHLGIVHQLQGGLRNLEREWRGLKERTFAVDKHYTKLMNRYRAQLLG